MSDGGGLRRYLTGGLAWSGIGLVFSVVLAFAVNAFAARILSTDNLAAFLLLVSLGQTLGVVVELGLPPLVVRELAERSSPSPSVYLSHAWWAVGATGVLVSVAAIVLASPVAGVLTDQPAVTALAPWVGALVAVRGYERLAGDSYRGLRDIPRAVGFGNVGTQLVGAVLLATLLFTGASDPDLVIGAYAAGGLVTAVVALVGLRSRMASTSVTRARSAIPGMLAESWPLIGHRGMFLVLQQAPLWIVGGFLAAGPTANYGLAQRIVTLIGFPLLIVNQVVPPLISRGALEEPRRLERTLRATATAAAVPAALVLGGLVVAGRPLLSVFFGAQYVEAAVPLAVLSIGQLANVMAGSCGPALTQTGHQRALWRITGVVTVVTLVVAAMVATPFGATGVAVVAAMGLIAQNVWMVVAVRRLVGLRTYVGLTALRDGLGELRRLLASGTPR